MSRRWTFDDGLFLGLLAATLARATLPDLATYLGSGRPAPNTVLTLTAPGRALSSLCSAAVVGLALATFVTRRRSDSLSSPVAWLWLLYLADEILSTALRGHFAVSTAAVSMTTLLAVALLDLHPARALHAVVACLAAVCLGSLLLVLTDPRIARYDGTTGSWFSRQTRLAGLFSTPNEMANVASLTVVAAVAGWALLGPRLRLLAVLSGALALALTESYTGLLAAGLCVLAAGTVLRRSTSARRAAAVLVVAGSAALVTVSGLIGSSSSLSERDIVWTYVRAHWAEHPWLGHGSTSWAGLIADRQVPTWAVHAHNQLLNSLFETGIVGLSICVLAVVGSLLATSRWRRETGLGTPRETRLGTRAVAYPLLLLEAIRGFTEVPFTVIWGGVDLAVILVVVALAAEPPRAEPSSTAPAAPTARAAPPLERDRPWEPSSSSTSTPGSAAPRSSRSTSSAADSRAPASSWQARPGSSPTRSGAAGSGTS